MKQKKKRISINPLNLSGKLIVWIYALIVTVPLGFAVITAFKTEHERVINPLGFPEKLQWGNFVEAWKVGNFLQAGWNSIIIATGMTVLGLFFTIVVAYSLDRIRSTKIGTFLYFVVLCAMFIPGVGSATGLMLRRSLGLYNNYWGEIFVGSLNITMGVFLISGTLRTMPGELHEAASIDGASDTRICFQIITPVIKPVLVTIAILLFRGSWNNCLGPMLTLRDEKLYTLPMTLYLNFTDGQATIYTTMFAGVLITSIPVIIIFLLCQDQFMNSLTGGVKG